MDSSHCFGVVISIYYAIVITIHVRGGSVPYGQGHTHVGYGHAYEHEHEHENEHEHEHGPGHRHNPEYGHVHTYNDNYDDYGPVQPQCIEEYFSEYHSRFALNPCGSHQQYYEEDHYHNHEHSKDFTKCGTIALCQHYGRESNCNEMQIVSFLYHLLLSKLGKNKLRYAFSRNHEFGHCVMRIISDLRHCALSDELVCEYGQKNLLRLHFWTHLYSDCAHEMLGNGCHGNDSNDSNDTTTLSPTPAPIEVAPQPGPAPCPHQPQNEKNETEWPTTAPTSAPTTTQAPSAAPTTTTRAPTSFPTDITQACFEIEDVFRYHCFSQKADNKLFVVRNRSTFVMWDDRDPALNVLSQIVPQNISVYHRTVYGTHHTLVKDRGLIGSAFEGGHACYFWRLRFFRYKGDLDVLHTGVGVVKYWKRDPVRKRFEVFVVSFDGQSGTGLAMKHLLCIPATKNAAHPGYQSCRELASTAIDAHWANFWDLNDILHVTVDTRPVYAPTQTTNTPGIYLVNHSRENARVLIVTLSDFLGGKAVSEISLGFHIFNMYDNMWDRSHRGTSIGVSADLGHATTQIPWTDFSFSHKFDKRFNP